MTSLAEKRPGSFSQYDLSNINFSFLSCPPPFVPIDSRFRLYMFRCFSANDVIIKSLHRELLHADS